MIELPVKNQNTKTMVIRPNGRSAAWIAPNYILGCNAGCSDSYCYVRRFKRPNIYVNQNWKEINQKVLEHSLGLPVFVSDQTDEKYWTYDICEASDLNYHWKDTEWESILEFYNQTPNIKATFATKFTNKKLESIMVNDGKLRLRFSLMPQLLSNKLEPNTSKVKHKLDQVEKLQSSGWDVHFNFSPVIFTDNWIDLYKKLFEQIKERQIQLKSEVIFLTHNEFKHNDNLSNNFQYEDLLWKPEIQEEKQSQYGGTNIRYKVGLKSQMINEFKFLYSNFFPIETIRYIF
jgi:spore photoproduct lyase